MKILALSPHTDDSEVGAGGYISRLLQEGHEVYYAAFSSCHKPELIQELLGAMKSLGVDEENIELFDFEVRKFNFNRQEVLDKIIYLRDKINPDTVLVPSSTDIHQDHQVVRNEALRIFKHINILGYEMPWNNLVFETKFFVKLEKRHVEEKIKALSYYKSQSHRSYMQPEFIESLAKVRGVQCNHEFAECFEIIRQVI